MLPLRTVSFIFPVDEDVTNKLYFGRALPVSLKNAFKNKAITCVEYEDLTAEQEREIFRVGDIPPTWHAQLTFSA